MNHLISWKICFGMHFLWHSQSVLYFSVSLKWVVQRWQNTVLISIEHNLYNDSHSHRALPARIIQNGFGIFPLPTGWTYKPCSFVMAKWQLKPTKSWWRLYKLMSLKANLQSINRRTPCPVVMRDMYLVFLPISLHSVPRNCSAVGDVALGTCLHQ